MNEAFEKILERLEEKENESILKAPNTGDFNNPDYQKWMMKSFGFKESIKIVQEVAEEYNITNGDKIRSMSDEELAEFIKHISHNCLMNALFSVNDEDCKHYEDCESCREAHKTVKEWIQSKAE